MSRNLLANLDRDSVIKLIDQWVIGSHGERDREIMFYRLIDGLTHEETALRYQENHPDKPISVDTIKRAVYRRIEQLSRHCPGK